MKIKRTLALMLALLLFAGVFAGCAKTETPAAATPASEDKTEAPAAEKTETPAAVEASGDEIVVKFARPEEIATWDPLNNNAIVNSIHNNMVYDGLFQQDVNYNILPCLAESYEVSDDNLTITFHIVKGVKFHNGDDLTAHDVFVTYNRLLEPDCALTQKSNFACLEGLKEIDDYTIEFQLNTPNAYLFTLLCKPIINGRLFEEMGEDCFELNIGTGPYKYVEWKPGVSIEYVKNEDYWQGETSNVDRVFYIPLMEDTTRTSAVRTGDCDMVDSIPTDQVPTLEAEGLNVMKAMTCDQLYIGYQFQPGPKATGVMADKNVRLAFSMAIDREAIANEILGSGRAATFPVGEGGKGFDANYPGRTYDPEKAKELLANSSYNGETIRVIGPTANYEKITETMTAIYYYLTAVGFNVDMEQLENAAFSDARKAGEYDCYIVGASFGGGDGYNFINQRIVGDSLASHYGNEELNEMILATNGIMDDAARCEALKGVYTKIMDDCAPMDFIVQYQFNYVFNNRIKSVDANGSKAIDLSTIWVNE